MDIFPQNLSSRYHVELVRRRSAKGFGEPQVDEPIPKPQLGKIGSYWAQGMELTEEQAALAAPASAMGTKGVASVTMLLGGIFVALTGVAVGASLRNAALGFSVFGAGTTALWFLAHGPVAEFVFRKAHEALSPKEVEDMISRCQDELSKAYLQLARDAVLVEANEATALKVREALSALGEAIDALPAVVIEPQDTGLLRVQARELTESAATETDAVIAASLLRQAESAEQRAESQEKSALVGRRAAVLREEILSKIAALRDAIAAQQSGTLDATALAALSESARSVAKESQNAASAHDELERYLIPQEAPLIQQSRQ
ncbi:hypothetical protein [Armatimonas sp.]|uniref:hypothetical protein n=1 Tax=Armatimonas sp. TaxID=1872638 RepID=UPI003751BB42